MSKGLGHIQRAIVELIAAEPDGAWQTRAICSRVYGISKYAVSKSNRVAVSRALRTMKLPGTWTVERSRRRSGEAWLCDPRNDKSPAAGERWEPSMAYIKSKMNAAVIRRKLDAIAARRRH
jgi:hypothetical protein